MSRLVRSIGAVAGVGFPLAMAAGCGARKPDPRPGLNDVQLAGWQVYADLDCATCHGENRESKRSGPALSCLAGDWMADQLLSHFTDLDEMVGTNPRLAYKAEKFAIGMPKVSGKSPGCADKVPDEQLEVLAEHMLFDIQTPGSPLFSPGSVARAAKPKHPLGASWNGLVLLRRGAFLRQPGRGAANRRPQ